ncbi:GlsB/YeaQ/YmgE family stress response membrane protein [Bacillus sp. FSL M7-1020]|uniref:GlsB/YeaQ/YmgE family stress response membrane protein n=1 Tax=Bacillus sp. FSL M7-1020 TaxID=2921540 RepID=UPI0009B4B0A7
MGWIITLIVGAIIGASLGGRLFGSFGPSFGGIHVVPALLGAIVLILIVSFVVKAARK